MYCLALIGDIEKSRSIAQRADVQDQLKQTLADLNARSNTGLSSPYTITLGDEFQALYADTASLWKDIFYIESVMQPVQIRFGMGLGEISTPLNQNAALGMDGPAFYQARDAITQIKKSKDRYKINGLESDGELINNTLALISDGRKKWEENRVHICYSMLCEDKVEQIASHLNISEQAVYKNIQGGSLKQLERIFTSISEKMDRQIGQKSASGISNLS